MDLGAASPCQGDILATAIISASERVEKRCPAVLGTMPGGDDGCPGHPSGVLAGDRGPLLMATALICLPACVPITQPLPHHGTLGLGPVRGTFCQHER